MDVEREAGGGTGSARRRRERHLHSMLRHERIVEDQFLVFKVCGLWSRSLTLFQVDVFMVLSQDKVHLLLTLQLMLKNALMSLVKGFFALFPKIKKSAKLASHSSPRVPASVSPSTPAAQLEVAPLPDSIEWVQLRERHAGKIYYWNRRTNSTVWPAPAGVEVVWIGERNEEGGVWYWHRDTRVSTFDLLGEERYRQPRAAKKYWAPSRLCCVEIIFTVTMVTGPAIRAYRLIGVRALPCGLDYDQFPLRLSCGDGFSDVLTAYGPLVSGSHFSLLVA